MSAPPRSDNPSSDPNPNMKPAVYVSRLGASTRLANPATGFDTD